jgi:hypothetical protein
VIMVLLDIFVCLFVFVDAQHETLDVRESRLST